MRRTIIDTTNLELTDKVVSIKRVTKVVKGGRNMRFTALVVVGDGNGHVGVGLGKSIEIPEAIRKGKEDAAKHLVSVALDENNSVTHDFLGKYGSSTVLLKKAPEGTGIIAGGPARGLRAGWYQEYPYQGAGLHQQAECRSGNHSGIKPDQDS